jgi:HEAT repeat protein
MGKRTIGIWSKARTQMNRILKVGICASFLLILSVVASAQTAQQYQAAINSGDAEAQRNALFELKKIGTEDASRVALPALKSSDELVRATAASAVVWLRANEAVEALLPLLNDESDLVRREAAFALGEVGDPSAAGPLIRLIEKEDSLETKNAAVIALGKIGDVSALRTLVNLLSKKPNDDNEFTRRSAARSIGQIAAHFNRDRRVPAKTPKNFLPLKYKEIEPEADAAVRSGYFGDAVNILINVVQNRKESFDTRREAAAALGLIGDRRAAATLDSCRQSTDPYLSEACKEASLRLR